MLRLSDDEAKGRIDELEFRFLHQEKLLEHLNEVVIEQRALIARLENALGALKEQVGGLTPQDGSEEPPPPHY